MRGTIKMRDLKIKFFIIILCVSFISTYSVNATNWYVDNAVSTSGNGQSWSGAWKSFSNIDWSQIGTDTNVDTIYISGGTTSKTYNEQLNVPQGKQYIVITKGTVAGHNGEVIIDGQNSRSYGINLDANGGSLKNITISSITTQNCVWSGIYADGENSGGLMGLLIENCKALNNQRAGIFIEGNNNYLNNYDITIRNCYVDDPNTYVGQSDTICLQWLSSARVTGNTLILDNSIPYTGDVHSDNIQTYWVDDMIIDNNYMYQNSPSKVLGTQTLFTQEAHSGSTHVYYNNVIYANEPSKSDWTVRTKANDGKIVYIIHNTVYGYGRIQGSDAPGYLYNNIFYGKHSTGGDTFSSLGSPAVRTNNLVYDADGMFGTMSGSIESDPLFTTTTYSTSWKGDIQAGSPAKNLGGDYKSIIEGFGLEWKDINGVLRDSTPTVGAVELGGGISGCVNGQTQSCSTGQPGICAIGTQTCSNNAWGSCIAPNSQTEICGNNIDEDCNGGDLTCSSCVPISPADNAPCDGCVSLGEISSYVSLWLNNQGVTLSQCSSAVSTWMGGC